MAWQDDPVVSTTTKRGEWENDPIVNNTIDLKSTVSSTKIDPLIDGTENAEKVKFTNYVQQKGYKADLNTIDNYRNVLFGKDMSYASINKKLTNELSVESKGNVKSTAKYRIPHSNPFIPQGMAYNRQFVESLPDMDTPKATDVLKDAGIDVLNSTILTAQGFFGMMDLLTYPDRAVKNKILNKFGINIEAPTKQAQNLGLDFNKAREFYDSFASNDTKMALVAVANEEGVLNKIGAAIQHPEAIRKGVLESSLPMIGGGVIGRAVKISPIVAAGIGEAFVSSGIQTSDIISNQETDLTPKQFGLVMSSAFSTALISMASGGLQKKMGLVDFDTKIASKGLPDKKQMNKALSVPLGAFFEGFVEEYPQGTIETITGNLAKDKPWNEGLDDAQAMGIIAGVAMGAGINIVEQGEVTGYNGGAVTSDDITTLRNRHDIMENLEPSEQANHITKAVNENDGSSHATYNQNLVGVEPTIEMESKQSMSDVTINGQPVPMAEETQREEKGLQEEKINIDNARKEIGITPEEIDENGGWIFDEDGNPYSESINRSRSKLTSKLLTPVLQRAKDLGAEPYRALFNYEFETHTKKREYQLRVKNAIDSILDISKKSPVEFTKIDSALRNGDFNAVYKNIPKEQIDEVRLLLNEIANVYESVGINISRRENYFPRRVKDYEGLMNHFGEEVKSEIEVAIKDQMQKAQDMGYTLSQDEVAKVINQVLMQTYKTVGGKKPKAAMKRSIEEVTDDIAPYYYDSVESLLSYINEAVDVVELRKFFGKDLVLNEGMVDVNNSIGNIIAEMVEKGQITSKDQHELVSIFRARFGVRPTGKLLSVYKSLVAMTTLGQIENSFTQFGDAMWSFYENSIPSTIISGIKKKKITLKDMGITEISEDLRTVDGWHKMVNNLFKITGLKAVDVIGKEALVNATIDQYIKQAKTGRFDEKKQMRLNNVFGDNQDQVIQDLKEGKITSDVKRLAFATLLDWQPSTLSNMPAPYLTSEFGRTFYTLKTFTIMQLDNFRRVAADDIVNGIADGDVKQAAKGFKNMLHLATLFLLANVPIDLIKDMLSGKEISLSDIAIENIYKLFGLSRYAVEFATRKGQKPSQALLATVVPPVSMFDYPATDIQNIFKKLKEGENIDLMNLESWKLFPAIGRSYYYRFGGGKEKADKAKKSKGSYDDIFKSSESSSGSGAEWLDTK